MLRDTVRKIKRWQHNEARKKSTQNNVVVKIKAKPLLRNLEALFNCLGLDENTCRTLRAFAEPKYVIRLLKKVKHVLNTHGVKSSTSYTMFNFRKMENAFLKGSSFDFRDCGPIVYFSKSKKKKTVKKIFDFDVAEMSKIAINGACAPMIPQLGLGIPFEPHLTSAVKAEHTVIPIDYSCLRCDSKSAFSCLFSYTTPEIYYQNV